MKILFIRHAQSSDAQADISQRDNSPLSELGKEQAKRRAYDLRNTTFNGLYVSHYARSQETADIIFPSRDITTLDFIYEIKRPRILDGGLHSDAVHFWEVDHIKDKYLPDWKYDGSESFNEVVCRTKKLIRYLYDNHLEGDTVAVVTHGGFIKHMIGYTGLLESYKPEIFFNLFFLLQIKNAGIIEVELLDGVLLSWKIHND